MDFDEKVEQQVHIIIIIVYMRSTVIIYCTFAVNSANITPPSSAAVAVAGYTIIQCKLQSEDTQTDRSSAAAADDDDDNDDQC